MILFLTSCNNKIGYGHLKRCHYLKRELDKKKIKSYFFKSNKNKYTLENNIKKNCNLNNNKIDLFKIKKAINKKNIKIIIIDDYRYSEKHRKIFKRLGCLIIQLNYFYDTDKYIDICINYLKKKKNKPYVINSLNDVIISPYKKFNVRKRKIILVYFYNPKRDVINNIINSVNLDFKNYKIYFLYNSNKNYFSKFKSFNNIKFLKLKNDISYYFAISEFLISAGGLTCIESSRYKVKNIVINLNKKNLINSKFLKKKKIIHYILSKKFSYRMLSGVFKKIVKIKNKKIISFQSTENVANKIFEYLKRSKLIIS